MLIDSHCHLNFNELYDNIDYYISEMKTHDVGYAVCIGTRPDNLKRVVSIADTYPNIFATVGIHPDEKLDTVITKSDLECFLSHPKVIGIGETGLDYYDHNTSTQIDATIHDFKWQHDRFRLHIEVATKNHLPLIIHTRKSFSDTIAILKEYDLSNTKVVMHCFTENIENAKICIDLGFYISISGIVTFKNATSVQEMANFVPLKQMLIETDAPFLAPVPYRGKLNHPALVSHTALFLSKLKNIPLDELANQTTKNFLDIFTKAHQFIKQNTSPIET